MTKHETYITEYHRLELLASQAVFSGNKEEKEVYKFMLEALSDLMGVEGLQQCESCNKWVEQNEGCDKCEAYGAEIRASDESAYRAAKGY